MDITCGGCSSVNRRTVDVGEGSSAILGDEDCDECGYPLGLASDAEPADLEAEEADRLYDRDR